MGSKGSKIKNVKTLAQQATKTTTTNNASEIINKKKPLDESFAIKQSTKIVGSEDRHVRLVGYKLPGEDVKYVSREDYEIIKEWEELGKIEGVEQVNRRMEEINEVNLKEKEEWQKQHQQTMSNNQKSNNNEFSMQEEYSPEQSLLRKFTGGSAVKDLTKEVEQQRKEELEEDNELVSQTRDEDYLRSLQQITSKLDFERVDIPQPTFEEYKKTIGNPRARPYFEEIHGNVGKINLPHLNEIHENEKEEDARRVFKDLAYNASGRISSGMAGKKFSQMSFPETYRDVEIRKLLDIKREMESKGEDTTQLLKEFCEDHQMKMETLQTITKYVNSVYVYSPSTDPDDESYGFWNKIK
ncbi:hypothetical protein ABK040_000582 [Willaertia magna]